MLNTEAQTLNDPSNSDDEVQMQQKNGHLWGSRTRAACPWGQREVEGLGFETVGEPENRYWLQSGKHHCHQRKM